MRNANSTVVRNPQTCAIGSAARHMVAHSDQPGSIDRRRFRLVGKDSCYSAHFSVIHAPDGAWGAADFMPGLSVSIGNWLSNAVFCRQFFHPARSALERIRRSDYDRSHLLKRYLRINPKRTACAGLPLAFSVASLTNATIIAKIPATRPVKRTMSERLGLDLRSGSIALSST